MTTYQEGATAYAEAHPLTPEKTSWQNRCAQLMYEFLSSFTPGWVTHGNITTAASAMANSNLLFPVSVNDILPGRLVWLRIPGSVDGHVGFVVAGQGLDALVFWATDVLQIKLGNFIGFGTVREYEASAHHGVFEGVSEDYAGAYPNLSAFSEVGPPTPVTDPGDMIMKLIRNPEGAITEVGETTYRHLTLPDYNTSVVVWGPYEQFNDDASYNQEIVATQVRLAYKDAGILAAIAKITGAPAGGGSTVDPAAIAAAVEANIAADLAALEKEIAAINAEIGTPAEIAAAGGTGTDLAVAIANLAKTLGTDVSAIEAAVAGVPAAVVKAEGSALLNG